MRHQWKYSIAVPLMAGLTVALGGCVATYPHHESRADYPDYGDHRYPESRPDYRYRDVWPDKMDRRIRSVQQQISDGHRQGHLTGNEARRLDKELRKLLDRINRMQRDGYLDWSERKRIEDDIDRLQHHIVREGNDSDRRRY